MSGKGGTIVALAIAVVIGASLASEARADTLVDSFDSGLVPGRYTTQMDPGMSLETVGGELHFIGTGGTSTGTWNIGFLHSTFSLSGNFDVRVDYRDLVSPYCGTEQATSAGLHFYTLGGDYVTSVEREQAFGGDEFVAAYPTPRWGYVQTTDATGTLRMVRQGSTFTAYYNSTLLGTTTFTTDPLQIRFGMHRQNHLYATDVYMDNLNITADQIVPEPAGVLVLLAGAAAMLRRRR